jgi:hypothetical protein
MLGVACEMANAHGATLFIVDGDILRPYLIYNLPAEYIHGIGEVRVGAQCCGRAVEHRKPWIVTDMLTDPLFAEARAGAVAWPIPAAFSVPVLDRDNTIASLACHFTQPHTPISLDIERKPGPRGRLRDRPPHATPDSRRPAPLRPLIRHHKGPPTQDALIRAWRE